MCEACLRDEGGWRRLKWRFGGVEVQEEGWRAGKGGGEGLETGREGGGRGVSFPLKKADVRLSFFFFATCKLEFLPINLLLLNHPRAPSRQLEIIIPPRLFLPPPCLLGDHPRLPLPPSPSLPLHSHPFK